MIHATDRISRFVAALKYQDLTQDAIEQTKLYIADYFAACYAGYKVNGGFNEAVWHVLADMGGKEEATALFHEKKLPVMNAAFMNAVYAHGADMDDGNRKAMGHVAAHVMSTVFAMAEVTGANGKEIITAINAGYEVYNRVAAAVQPGLVHRGFHSTGTAGAIACGAVAGKMLGFDAQGIYHAMSLSAIQASGLIIVAESGQACKPINPANAAKTGILSALIVKEGIASSVYPLESKKGWFHAMSDEVDESAITEGLGETFTICESYLKPYPSCRHTHCGIEAAMGIRRECIEKFGSLTADMIERVDVDIYQNAIQIAGQIAIPQSPDDSKFSIHYSLAIALLKGHYTIDDLQLSNLTDDIKTLISRIRLIRDDGMEDTKRGIRGARVTVWLKNGLSVAKEVPIPKGDAANPFTWDDMEEKVRACTGGLMTDEQRERFMNRIHSFEAADGFGISE